MILDRISLKPLWAPSRAFAEQSNFKKYQNWLFVKKGLYFRDYHDLWDWSVTDLEDFWESIWQFCEVKSHSMYWDVLVNSKKELSDTQWFTGSSVNYAEHIFRSKNANRPALLYQSEREPLREVSWKDLEKQVAALAAYLRRSGVGVGDRVAAVLPNGPQTVIAFLAANSVGAVWTLCSPDMSSAAILDRFQPLEPKVLFAADGYEQAGKAVDRLSSVKEVVNGLPKLKATVLIPYLNPATQLSNADTWADVLKTPSATLEFAPVPFHHPLWVVFESGPSGKSEPIIHSVGGCLLEHFKIFTLHQNIKPGDRFFWYNPSESWMWHFSIGAMLSGAVPLLYEGKPTTFNVLWEVAEKAKINHFGGNRAYFMDCLKENLSLQGYKFNHLQSLSCTDAALPAEGFEWVYKNTKKDVWLISLNVTPTLCSSYVGGCPILPVYSGEAQCHLLGCKTEVDDTKEKSVGKDSLKLTLSQPMPSLPLSHLTY
ncbi:MAG: AMP-binding protein [Spirosomataceae bacterium]